MLRELCHSAEKCPFCGNTKIYIDSEQLFNAVRDEQGTAAIEIRCDNCSTSVWVYHHTDYYSARSELIAKWNRRA